MHQLKIIILIALTIFVTACAGSQTQKSTGDFVDDAVITTKVKTALINSPKTKGFSINVDTFKGRVLLSGFVDSKESIKVAEELAVNINGVKSVDNKLIIK